MKTKFKHLLGVGLSLLVTFGGTHFAVAQAGADRIVFSADVAVKDSSSKGKPTYTTTRQIFTMNPDGTGVEQLTDSTYNSAPRWSPDREYIAFHGDGGLRVMEASGEANGGRSFLVFSDVASTGSDWSPDGTMICFPWYGQGLGIVEVDPATGWVGEPTLVWGDAQIFWPSWSPDGSRIAFMSYRPDPESPSTQRAYLTILDLTSGEEQTLYELPATLPQWSPDGNSIAFSGVVRETITKGHKTTTNTYGEIFIANADFSGITQVTNLKGQTTRPSWSSDGTELAFMSSSADEYSIYTMSLLTGDTTLLWTHTWGLDWTP